MQDLHSLFFFQLFWLDYFEDQLFFAIHLRCYCLVGLCFLTSLFHHHGRWWFLTYLKPSGGVSSPLSYKLLYIAGVSSPSHEKLSALGQINLRFITWYHNFYWQWPSSSMMGYSPIAQKSPIDQMGKNIWEKSMVFFPIISIYLNGTNYHKLLLHYRENLWGKSMGKIVGENLWGKLMGKIYGEN